MSKVVNFFKICFFSIIEARQMQAKMLKENFVNSYY